MARWKVGVVVGQSEAFIHLYPSRITPEDYVANEDTLLFRQRYMDQFVHWIGRFVDAASAAA